MYDVQEKMTHFGTISEIWRYPVASLRGERVEMSLLDGHGVAGDRAWGLFDAESGAIAEPESARRWRFAPELLARLGADGPEISDDDETWWPIGSLQARGMASKRAGFAVLFAPLASEMGRATASLRAPRYDRGHLHILTTASLAALSALVSAEALVDVRRFRPNLVVETTDGTPGFQEKELIGRTVTIGEATVEITEPCERCSFTALAQGDLPFAKDVLHAIARHGGGGFGVLGRIVTPARLHIADRVRLAG